MTFSWKKLASPWSKGSAPVGVSTTPRRSRRMEFSWDGLEDRKVMSHGGALHHLHAAAVAHHVASTTSTSTTSSTVSASTSSTTSTTSSNSTLTTARQTLQKDVQTVLSASGTTIGELSAIHTAFQTLETDSLTPSSQSALSTFENSLVTSFASGTTLTGNATLLSQFEGAVYQHPDDPADDRPHHRVQRPGGRRDLLEHHRGEYHDHQHRLRGRPRRREQHQHCNLPLLLPGDRPGRRVRPRIWRAWRRWFLLMSDGPCSRNEAKPVVPGNRHSRMTARWIANGKSGRPLPSQEAGMPPDFRSIPPSMSRRLLSRPGSAGRILPHEKGRNPWVLTQLRPGLSCAAHRLPPRKWYLDRITHRCEESGRLNRQSGCDR